MAAGDFWPVSARPPSVPRRTSQFAIEKPNLPVPIRSYAPPAVPASRLGNSKRLHDLLRAGKLYLTVQDALALAIENNLNLEVDRYGPLLAQSALERAKGRRSRCAACPAPARRWPAWTAAWA